MPPSDHPPRARNETPKPARWLRIEARDRKAAAAALDLALERQHQQGRTYVLLELMLPDLAPAPAEYAAHLLANMEEIASDLSVLADDPLSANPDSSVVFHLEMTSSGERVEGHATAPAAASPLSTKPRAAVSRSPWPTPPGIRTPALTLEGLKLLACAASACSSPALWAG